METAILSLACGETRLCLTHYSCANWYGGNPAIQVLSFALSARAMNSTMLAVSSGPIASTAMPTE
jgi:hypothetical protein